MTDSRRDRDDSAHVAQRPPSSAGLVRLLPVAILLGGLVVGYLLGLQHYLSLQAVVDQRDKLIGFVGAHMAVAAALFFIIYTLAVAFSFPAASILTIVGGFLFGWLLAATLTVVAATLGASAVFLAARFASADLLRQRAGPWLGGLAAGFRENAFAYLIVLRLAPIFPFFVVNIAPAFFDVGLRSFVTATFVGIIPGTFAYAYLGAGLDSVITAAANAGRSLTISDVVTPQITVAFVALAGVAAVAAVVRRVRAGQHPVR